MTVQTPPAWQVENQRYLMAEISRIHQRLKQYLAQQQGESLAESLNAEADLAAIAASLSEPPALAQLCQTFDLSPFERDIMLLCAGVEFGSGWAELCAALNRNPQQGYPSFELAKTFLEAPHWSAFLPTSALRRWQLVDVGPGSTLLSAQLRLDERILHALLGFPHVDERLMRLVETVAPPARLVDSHQRLAQQMATAWQQTPASDPLPILQLCGIDRATKQAIAAQACDLLNLPAYTLSSKALPTGLNDLREFIRLWEREALLDRAALLLDWDDVNTQDAARENGIALLMESLQSPFMVISRDRRPPVNRPVITYDIHNPTRQEQKELWQSAIAAPDANGFSPDTNGFVEPLIAQFNLSANQIKAASLQALSLHPAPPSPLSPPSSPSPYLPHLWHASRLQARPQLDDLAQRLSPRETWSDLILPDQPCRVLREIVAHIRQRTQVYETWGFSSKSNRGLGISALFAGVSGTGKTMAAGVLAQAAALGPAPR
ncbi:MAG: ATP-binding protein, partial [Leptolyngbya sp. SIO4C5]|nr:ATP-binding protein [Leptolyngbya sp. SIO4C5]